MNFEEAEVEYEMPLLKSMGKNAKLSPFKLDKMKSDKYRRRIKFHQALTN